MSIRTEPLIDQARLVKLWNRTLPGKLNESDQTEVRADEADVRALRIHVVTAGHTGYTFDFKCTYVDSREVKVEFVDVEQSSRAISGNQEIIQTLVKDYVRHIHECAQALHTVTHG